MEQGKSYRTFGVLIAVSTAVMFVLMYLNTYEVGHVWWSQTRAYMTLIMGAAMAVVMLVFMRGMYTNTRWNLAICAGSAAVFLLALGLVRSQVTVTDRAWMSAMIPHHSIAILTSERAGIKDLRVRQLADDIIAAQEREIREMEWLIDDIRKNGVAADDASAAARPVPDFSKP